VRATILDLGGYWRPAAGVVRLLEELAELAELLLTSAAGDALSAELADVWIITTAVADQFLGEVAEPGADERRSSGASGSLAELITAAGPIARIVNYYDGPKTPRSVEGWPSLNDATAELHRALAAFARVHDVDLATAVEGKLDVISGRDSGRFERVAPDPSTAASVEAFRASEAAMPGTEKAGARLWGAPAWSDQHFAANVDAIVPELKSFARAARRERFDGYVIAGPMFSSRGCLSEWRDRLMQELSDRDRCGRQVGHPDPPSALAFEGLEIAVTTLSPLYRAGHECHSPKGTFVLIEPKGDGPSLGGGLGESPTSP